MDHFSMMIISTELIKPSSPSIHHHLPFKLSLLDQFFPSTYVPFIFFYPTNSNQSFIKGSEISTQLKRSLSLTLSTFYPLSGRVKNNSIIDNYQKGVPFIETQVKGNLLDFLKQPQLNLLNKFLPCQPLSYEANPEATPQVAIQLNTFDCGGIALGVCFSHKIVDGATAITFLDSWAANTGGSSSPEKIIVNPGLFKASSRFPPWHELLMKIPLWVKQNYIFGTRGKSITKRFVFHADAMATLKAKAKCERVPNPSRTEALSAFIWKSCIEACRSLKASPRPSWSLHPVNIRGRTKPCFPRHSIGNLWWMTFVDYKSSSDREIGLNGLVTLTRESFTNINNDFLEIYQGKKGFLRLLISSLKQLVGMVFKKPDTFVFSSWLQFDFNEVDFGWGKPIWMALTGQVGQGLMNTIFFKETGRNKEIEVWMTLKEKIMSIVEQDPEFLKFAIPNPSIV